MGWCLLRCLLSLLRVHILNIKLLLFIIIVANFELPLKSAFLAQPANIWHILVPRHIEVIEDKSRRNQSDFWRLYLEILQVSDLRLIFFFFLFRISLLNYRDVKSCSIRSWLRDGSLFYGKKFSWLTMQGRSQEWTPTFSMNFLGALL